MDRKAGFRTYAERFPDPTCCQCAETEGLHTYDGNRYCDRHLQTRLAHER